MVQILPAKPTASVTIEAQGPRSPLGREHCVRVTIRLPGYGKHVEVDVDFARRVARASLAGFPPEPGERDARRVVDLATRGRPGKGGGITSIIVGAEGSVVCPG